MTKKSTTKHDYLVRVRVIPAKGKPRREDWFVSARNETDAAREAAGMVEEGEQAEVLGAERRHRYDVFVTYRLPAAGPRKYSTVVTVRMPEATDARILTAGRKALLRRKPLATAVEALYFVEM